MPNDARWATKPYNGYGINAPLKEDEELTQVGPETPCGEYMRRFWHPVAMTSRLGEQPTAIRILGEDLVAFRDTSGRVGCSPSGAPIA